MATVHTQYGPGTIIASETVRGQRQFKVAGEGFEVWLDEAKIGGLREDSGEDRPQGWFADEEPAGAPRLTADELVNGAEWPLGPGYDRPGFGQGDIDEYGQDLDHHGYTAGRLAWSELDDENSTTLPYNPDPQHDAIGSFGDDGSSTIQPIHHIDADERLHSSDSITFDDEGEGEEPGPDPDLFARSSSRHEAIIHPVLLGPLLKNRHLTPGELNNYWPGSMAGQNAADLANSAVNKVSEEFDLGPGWGPLEHGASKREAFLPALAIPALEALGIGGAEAGAAGAAEGAGSGLVGDAAGMAARGLASGGHGGGGGGDDQFEPGEGWTPHNANRSYEGLSDRYIDLTASVDYHSDPVAQFRHDPDAYINRIGHIMDEGLNPRFAEYMDLVEADGGIREAAWKDVRKKAMRLKTSGAVHVKDIAPGRIMASVDGDHGTYDVTILKGATYGGAQGNSISNWHCACEWGKWAFRRKFTFVGRLCSHAYASYLTMQSEALKGQRPKRRNPSDGYIVNRPSRDQYLPTYRAAATVPAGEGWRQDPPMHDTGDDMYDDDSLREERRLDQEAYEQELAARRQSSRRQADNLQLGPERLTPELVVNDTDDAHIFTDVTKDERKDTRPEDVMSDKDIVHFARLMRHCEATEQPYPRQLVAFLARYAAESDDVPTDFKADDADDANGALDRLRADADRDQESELGNMADRVHRIQDAVEEARDNGADASQFVAQVRKMANDYTDTYDTLKQQVPTPAPQRKNNDSGLSVLWRTPDSQNPNLPRDEKGNPNPDAPWVGGGNKFDQPSSSPSGSSDPQAYSTLDDKGKVVPKSQPGQASPQATGAPSVAPVGGGAAAAPAGSAKAAPAAGGGAYTAPSGGQTSGTIADGGVAGAENGNNSAIGKDQLDADGYYTVQKGDTLSDIAQRSYGDMNKYQDLAKGNNIANPDVINEGQRIKIENPTGNGGVGGDKTNPAGGGSDNNIATPEKVDTSAASNPATATPTPPSGSAATDAVPPVTTPASTTDNTNPALNNPPAPAEKPAGTTASAKAWMRWAADGDSSSSDSGSSSGSSSSATPSAPRSAPASNPASSTSGSNPGTVGPSKSGDTYDPNTQSPGHVGNPFIPGSQGGGLSGLVNDLSSGSIPGIGGGGATSTPGGPGQGARPGDQISGIGNEIGSAVGNFLPGIGGAISGIGQGIGGLVNTFSGGGQQQQQRAASTMFSSQSDFDEWVRYAYPADMDNTGDPKLLPHHPFNGSGYAGPLEIGTSEDNVKQYRKDHEDVTDLDYDVHADLGELQKQGSYEDATDDGSDIVRSFQANMGGGFDSPSGGGRFDDFAGAAQGFLRTAGRNYSLAEQDELIREGDKGGARNLASLDLKGTHYEDMTTLGW